MLKSRLLILVLIVLGVLLIGILVSGFGIANFWTFGGQRTIETSAGPRATVWIDTHVQYFRLLGVNLYARSRAPSSIQLEFNAAKNSCRAIDLHNVTLRYSDGQTKTVVEPNHHLRRALEDYQYVNWVGDGLVTNRSSRLVLVLTNVVDRMVAVTVTFKGDVVKDDGPLAAFSISEEFHPEKEIGISRGWQTASP